MSDIHGFLNVFQENLKRIDLSGENRLVLLGDYIDYGPESGRTLRLIFETQKRYGAEKVIVLRGNHEEMFLEWLDAYAGPHAGQPDADGLIPWSDWLLTDPDFGTFRSFLSEAQWACCAAGLESSKSFLCAGAGSTGGAASYRLHPRRCGKGKQKSPHTPVDRAARTSQADGGSFRQFSM